MQNDQLQRIWYKQKYVLLLAGIVYVIGVKAQSKEQELIAVMDKIPQHQQDSVNYELFKINRLLDIQKAKYYAQRSFQQAVKHNHTLIAAKAANALAFVYDTSNWFDSAFFYHHKAIDISIANKFQDRLVYFYNNIGRLFERLDFYDSALHYYSLSYELATELSSYMDQAIAKHNIGLIYSNLENYAESIHYLREAIEIKNAHGIVEGINLNLLNLANNYNNDGQYNEAIKCLKIVESNCKSGCDDEFLADLYYGFGYSRLKNGMPAEANSFFLQSLELSKKSNNKQTLAHTYYHLASFEYERGVVRCAIEYLKKAEKIALEIRHRRLLRDIYYQFAVIYDKSKKLKEVVHFQKVYMLMKDSIFNETLANNIRLIALDDQRKQMNSIILNKQLQLERQQLINAGIGILSILSVVIIAILFRSTVVIKRSRKALASANQTIATRNEELKDLNASLEVIVENRTRELSESLEKIRLQSEREKTLLQNEFNFLKNQFNSHITFNFLNFCYSKVHNYSGETAEAIELFSEMLRYSLVGRPDERVYVKKEIDYIENFIKLQKLLTVEVFVIFRYSGEFSDKVILPRILITFVENAFKHGQFNCPDNPITIELRSILDGVCLRVHNKKSHKRQMVNTGIGQENVMQILRLYYLDKYALSINDEPETYTCELSLNLTT